MSVQAHAGTPPGVEAQANAASLCYDTAQEGSLMLKRYFTVEEANRQVPELIERFRSIMHLRAALKTVYRQLEVRGYAPEGERFEIKPAGAPPEVARDRASFHGLLEALRDELAGIQAKGCLVKDLERGLVDWWARSEGRDVLLCWQAGEPEVAYWHDIETGFAGRRPVSELGPAEEAPAALLH